MASVRINPVERYLATLHDRFRALDDGTVATYIPELGKADPRAFGICIATADGHVYEVGDARQAFTVQSISKPFIYGLALEDRGKAAVLERIGVEPTGDAFNSISLAPDSGCPFCEGHEYMTPRELLAHRNGTEPDRPGWRLRVVPNQFPVLRVEGSLDRQGEGLFDKMNGIGAHEVIIESPRHEDTLATMDDGQIEEVLWAFRERVQDLKRDRRFRYIIIFKNHGAAAGAALDHSHSQIIALPIERVRRTATTLFTDEAGAADLPREPGQ